MRERLRPGHVALSGGVFQNLLLPTRPWPGWRPAASRPAALPRAVQRGGISLSARPWSQRAERRLAGPRRGSPTSRSTILVPPNAVFSCTIPGCSERTWPMTAACSPSGCARQRGHRAVRVPRRHHRASGPPHATYIRVDAEQARRRPLPRLGPGWRPRRPARHVGGLGDLGSGSWPPRRGSRPRMARTPAPRQQVRHQVVQRGPCRSRCPPRCPARRGPA